MYKIGRISFSFSEEYDFEYLFLKNIPNRSNFICRALKSFISNDDNLSQLEKFNKEQILNKK